MAEDPDRDLVLQCQAIGSEGFEAAFGSLYRRYRDRVFSLALRITGNRADALDAAQEAFVLLYQNIPSFQFDSKFSSWLYRLVVNASIDQLRRSGSRRNKKDVQLDPTGGETLAVADQRALGPRQVAENKELSNRIQKAMERLSPKLRVVTVLRYLQNLSYEDLAETLEISLGTVKSRLARAHLALADILQADHPGTVSRTTASTPAASPPTAGAPQARQPQGPEPRP